MSRKIGQIYEDRARAYLEALGFRILEQNYNTKYGEIDLITIEGDTLVFIEVKYRTSDTHGRAYTFVTPQKIAKIKRTAWHYIKSHVCHLPDNYRLDVVGIDGEEITHYRNVPINK